MMGIIGGAIVPLAVGMVTDSFGQTSGMLVLGICLIYLVVNSLWNRKKSGKHEMMKKQ
jgi:fucose permease